MLDDVKIAPSLLAADQLSLGSEVGSIAGADFVHVDVMDGHFVGPINFGTGTVGALKRATDLPLDVHLMIDNPDEHFEEYLDAGADILTFHVESARHAHRIVEGIHARGAKAGVSLCPATPVSALDELIDLVDVVLVMTVDPGYGGQPLIPSSFDKIARLRSLCRERGADPAIEVDGGVNLSTAAEVVRAGATRLVAGSAVFGAGDRSEAIAMLRETARGGLAREA